MYHKECVGAIFAQKAVSFPEWIRWTHHSEGKTHCEECLILDGCWFLNQSNDPEEGGYWRGLVRYRLDGEA